MKTGRIGRREEGRRGGRRGRGRKKGKGEDVARKPFSSIINPSVIFLEFLRRCLRVKK